MLILFLLLAGFGQLKGQGDLISLYYEGEFQVLISEAERLTSNGEASAEIYFLKALAEIQLARHNAAIRTLDSAMLNFPQDRRFPRTLAEQYYRTGQYREARSSYEKLTEEDPEDLAAWMRRAEVESFYQNYVQCLWHLDKVLLLDSTHLGALMLAGETLKRQKQDSALKYYRRAWTNHPRNQKAAYALANEYIQQKKPLEAVPVVEFMLFPDTTNIRFNKLLGYAFYKAGKPHTAIDPFSRAISLGSQDHFTYKYLGMSYYMTANFTEAINILSTAITIDSTDAEVEYFLGSSLATTKRKQEAIKHLQNSLKLMQPNPSAVASIYSEMGNTRRLMEDHELALELYGKAWETDSSKVIYLYYKASILDNSLGRDKEALNCYREFIRLLDEKDGQASKQEQMITIRKIVEDRIELLNEELFFRDED